MSKYLIKEDVDNILKEYASKAWNDDWKPTHETVRGDTFIEACLIIDDMPTVDAQPVKYGQWKYYKNNGIIDTYICTNCRGKVEMAIDVEPSKFKYCPNCGARMTVK